MRFIAAFAIVSSAIAVSAPALAQKTVNRCAAAKVMLADKEALVQSEIDYFTAILESAQCSEAETAPAEPLADPGPAAPAEPVVSQPAPPEPSSTAQVTVPAQPALEPDPTPRAQPVAAVRADQQEPVLPVGKYSATHCREALKNLTGSAGSAAPAEEENALLEVVTSEDCRALRAQRARQMSADPGIAAMMQTLREGGIDVEARMPAQVERCQAKVDSELAAGATGERQRMIDGCVAVARQIVYSAAINELNDNVNAAYEREMAEHRAELARLEAERQEKARKEAAEKAAYEKEMAEWRRKVKLCNEGKREYCHNE